MDIRVQSEAFDSGAEVSSFSSRLTSSGAAVSFTGIVRNNADGTLKTMEIEHYPGMTSKAISEIAENAKAKWNLENVMVIHRFGSLQPGEEIMMVATASAHRKNAFEAAEYLMDYLKSCAPFWKKEITDQGGEWVAAKSDDEDALKRW